ncbi:putative membrane protein, TIGR04086 family [Alkalithermobacter thermoalcaliphilus JW-YL-7 = DSM 7308]|uniref:Membrane protein, TIGR04086 family n=1 Tax=Alkalithermobacter thermoalcaliphilus JW-YL-7 = DSM 7308 TaxID=1121328 RepID=A0A150FP47_CLOPD|nr:Protein of unknown function DUF3792, transmembrane [[Clostridium] paradoxum JW-YL-7 = DSM 7308]SHK52238.1 putative membrane protein, TIGR04086 family [[Clostridium] paradoxum JW-YL-7 = DSM 7308]
MSKISNLFKSLGYAYLVTMALILIYNLVLTYTNIQTSTIPLATSIITTMSAAVAGMYMSYKSASKGLLYGLLAGAFYVISLILVYYLVDNSFSLQVVNVYKMLLNTIAGGIGGIIGVNIK